MTTADAAALSLSLTRAMLSRFPLIDGHNDLPWELRDLYGSDLSAVDLTGRLPNTHTDIPRLVEGGVGGQFWSVYVPAALAGDTAVTAVLEQIDLVHRMIERYPARFQLALTAADVDEAFGAGRIASLLGAEGGHSIAGSLGVLIVSPLHGTAGASGAIFALMGGAFTEAHRRGIDAVRNQLVLLIVINLVLTLSLPNISIGAHLGGLIGGGLVTLGYQQSDRLRRPALGYAIAAAISVIAVAASILIANNTGLS